MPIVVANRYARALADVVAPKGNYRQVLNELQDFGTVYQQSQELREVFETPAVSMAQKLKVLEAVAAELGSSSVTLNFLRVVTDHYRVRMFGEILQAFRSVAYARLGIVQVKVSSATALSGDEQELLRKRFSELTGHQPELEFHLDSGLIGGLVAQIGSTVFDGSIRGQLERVREKLIQG
jgi:F-type H+-transporting ATPase subunit delta